MRILVATQMRLVKMLCSAYSQAQNRIQEAIGGPCTYSDEVHKCQRERNIDNIGVCRWTYTCTAVARGHCIVPEDH